MKVFVGQLEWKTHEQLANEYWDHRVLLIDPDVDVEGNIKGGYLKAVSICGDPHINQLRKQFPDRKAMIVEYSYLVYKALGMFPFERS